MTRINTPVIARTTQTRKLPTVWVKTSLEGKDKYHLNILERSGPAKKNGGHPAAGRAYARLSLMESGAVMATFPVMGMVTGTIRHLLGSTTFELATPFQIPEHLFGVAIEIPAGRHPLVFVLENWVVLFRPENTLKL